MSQNVAGAIFGVGGSVASTVYGTVVIMATLTAAYATEKDPWRLAILVASTALVLWLAHIYAHGLSESLARRRWLTSRMVWAVARREIGMLIAAAAPIAALLLGALGAVDESTAVFIAMTVGIVTLAAEGHRYARIENLGRLGTTLAITANVLMGSFVVLLKVVLAH